MAKTILTIILMSVFVFLTACGTKGDLYIPEQRYPQKEVQQQVPAVSNHATDQLT